MWSAPTSSRFAGGLAAALAVLGATGTALAGEPVVVADAAGAGGAVTTYWTPARMRAAIQNSGEGPSEVFGWAARAGGAKPAAAQLPGMKAIGRVFATKPDGSSWSCTGTLIDSPTKSVVWTAAHCIHPGRGGAAYTNLAFAPGYQPTSTGNPMPFGLWPALQWAASGVWVRKGSSVDNNRRVWQNAPHDMAGLVLARDASGRSAGQAVGGTQHIRFRVRGSRGVRMIGYPVAAPYLGERLMQCGPARSRTRRGAAGLVMIPCPLSYGMSGGPALTRVNSAGWGTVIGEMTITDYRHMFYAFQGRESRRLYRHLTRIR